jgi:hypothetical protein
MVSDDLVLAQYNPDQMRYRACVLLRVMETECPGQTRLEVRYIDHGNIK